MSMNDIKMLLIMISTHVLSAYIGYITGQRKHGTQHRSRQEEEAQNADLVQKLQIAYNNGIRVGRQQMIDEMAHAHLISDDTADALSEGARR